jgi:hypothetical protein
MKGEDIIEVFKYIQQFFDEVAQLISKIDDSMIKENWKPLHGTYSTTDCSKSWDRVYKWLPYFNFRVYNNKKFPNIIKNVTIVYDTDVLKQPIIICGIVEYKDKKSIRYWKDYQILYHLWIEDKNANKKRDGTIYRDFSHKDMNLAKKVSLFSHNLIDIKNEMELNNKIIKQLKMMK